MGVGNQLNSEVGQWAVLAIVLVIFMVILGNMDNVGQRINSDATTNASVQTAISDFITGLSEPKNWVAIFVIALIGFSIITFVRNKRGG